MYNFKDKKSNVIQANKFMFAKTSSMFEWENLPESIPYDEIEKLLQQTGWAFVTEVDGELYAFKGGLGGEVDVYGNPTEITINNVALKFNKTLNIKEDGVLIRNDDSMMGFTPILNKFNLMMVENDLNMVIHGYNNRIGTMISASDDKTKESAETFLEKIVEGELAVIGEAALFEGVKSHAPGRTDPITSLIEYQQYIKASLFNEIGLNANFNMKRERLNSAEVLQNEDTIYPFVDNMMKCRLKGVEALNQKYGLEISIDYGSVWADKRKSRVDDVVDEDESDKAVDDFREEVIEDEDEAVVEEVDTPVEEVTVVLVERPEEEEVIEPEPEPETDLSAKVEEEEEDEVK